MEKLTAHELFLSLWNDAPMTSFDVEWANGTGYYDYATDDESIKLAKGEMLASLDTGSNRKLLLIGTGQDTSVVLFERYSNGQNGVIVSNTPRHLRGFEEKTKSSSSLNAEAIELVLNELKP